MSQIYKSLASGPTPPAIPTQFTADDTTTAVPVANNLNVFSRDTTDNNVNGVQTTADPDAGDNLYLELTNRIRGTATTTDSVTLTQVASFSLGAAPATYLFEHRLIAFNATQSISAGYNIFQVYRTDGVTATKISGAPGIIAEETDMINGLSQFTSSGNNVVVNVQGINADTIRWYLLSTYIKVV